MTLTQVAMHTPTDIRQQLSRIAKEELGWTQPLPTGDLGETLDSMQRLSLVVEIEDHFEICFDPEEEETLNTLDDVIRVIDKKLQCKNETPCLP